MKENFKSFLYKFDFFGTRPQLLIFTKKRYKSILSALISIIIIVFSIIFGIFSLFEYLKYDSPIISFTKNNDDKTERTFQLKDLILMFQLIDIPNSLQFKIINSSIAYYKPYYFIVYNNGTVSNTSLNIEKCELGKNIDLKYKDLADERYTFGKKLEEFYCISHKHKNLSIFYHPNKAFSSIRLYAIMKNNSIYSPENIQNLIASENNIIEHNNKNNPIRKSYICQFTQGYSSSEFTTINYNFQYIKYESDEGPFYKKSKILNGVSFSDMAFFRNKQNSYDLQKNLEESKFSIMGLIEIGINKSNFDNYQRTYQRLQSLLAEIMSVVNLLFQLGRLISNIVCKKKMNCDIAEALINKKNSPILIQHNYKRMYNLISKNEKNSERKKLKPKVKKIKKSVEKDRGIKCNKSKESNELISIRKMHKEDAANNTLEKINYFHIIKSFLCFKDERTKIINECSNIINEDLSIERILERFYNLENIYNYISNKEEEINDVKDKRFDEINKYIININNEIKKEDSTKEEKDKNLKENETIK